MLRSELATYFMNPTEKDKLIHNVVKLEELSKNPQYTEEFESYFQSIILSLVGNDGYQAIYNPHIGTPTSGITDIDFLCTKDNSTEILGVSYKRNKAKVNIEHVRYMIATAFGYPYNRVIMMSLEGFTNGCSQLIKEYEPVHIELLDLNDIKNWISKIETESDLKYLEYEDIIKIVSKTFIEKIVTDPSFLQKMEWREMEKMIAEIFEGLAFKVTLTPATKDGGKDLILEMTRKGATITYIVEIKHWRSMQRVGQSSTREFLNVICKEKRESGLFLSTYGFTENAFEGLTELERTKVKFGAREKVISLCKTYLRVRTGIWTPLQDLHEVLFEQTN